MGVLYSDFDKYVILKKQITDLSKYQNGKFGYVLSLSNANTEGSHWLSLFIDFNTNSVFYFDSNGVSPK